MSQLGLRRRKWAIALVVLMTITYATWRTRSFFRAPPRAVPRHAAPHAPARPAERVSAPTTDREAEPGEGSASPRLPDDRPSSDASRARDLGSLVGRVLVRGTGEPVGGAAVHVEWSTAHEPAAAVTAHDGTFVVRDAPAGPCQITVEATGFRQPSAQLARVAEPDPRAHEAQPPVDVLVDRALTVDGQVVEASGDPVSGAMISTRGAAALTRTSSDRDGHFSIDSLSAGTDLAVEHPQFARVVVPWTTIWEERERGLTITLAPGAVVSGEVLDEDGTRAARIQVRALVRSPETPSPTFANGVTDPNGHFELRSLPGGDIYVEATPLGGGVLVSLAPFALAPGEQRTDLLIRLHDAAPEASIEGVVRSSDGEPIRGATVTAGRAAAPPARVQTDETGSFRLSGLAAGDYALTAQAPKHQWTRVPNVPAGTSGLTITLSRGGLVTGRVVDGRSGEPLRSFQLAGQPIETNDGRFEYAALDTKRATFAVRADGYASRELGPFDAAGRDSVDAGTVALQPEARVRGQAFDARGEPLTGATIFAVATETPQQRTWERTVTDIAGAFEIGGLAAGRWCIATSLRASRDGCNGGATIRTRAGEVLDRVRITSGD